MSNIKISIVTVSYNAVETIERTINSVINQNYTNYEYIVIDGLSNDGTLDVLKKHESKITKLISEKDSGIYDAMNKGISMSRGEVICFLNSDDYFKDVNLLRDIAYEFSIDENISIIYGDYLRKNSGGMLRRVDQSHRFNKKSLRNKTVNHQTIFAKKIILTICVCQILVGI